MFKALVAEDGGASSAQEMENATGLSLLLGELTIEDISVNSRVCSLPKSRKGLESEVRKVVLSSLLCLRKEVAQERSG